MLTIYQQEHNLEVVSPPKYRHNSYAKYKCSCGNWTLETALHETVVTAPSLAVAIDIEQARVLKHFQEHVNEVTAR